MPTGKLLLLLLPKEFQERYNGLVLSVLRCSMGSPSEMETCVKKLQAFGVRISLEQCRSTIQNTVLRPDIKRYLFFNSRGFGLALAVIFYICVWANLYSTVRMFSFGQSWWSGIAVSLAAALITTVTILVIDCQQREINVNTDVRLAAANESFLKHCLLVGVTDDKQNYSNSLQLWFVHFDPKGCLWYLSQRLDVMKQSQMPALRKCLDHLCIVIETVVDPGPDETEGRVESGAKRLSEEMPLLSKGASARTKPLLYSQIMPLIQEGASEVMAHQLVVVFSACYVRLLVTGQLPEVSVTRHSEKMNAPCLCQFIETTALEDGPFWTKPR
ncbi:transmembrane protein 268 isoform X2 [Ambystoma mexicanum]|uniref:transmembrane protein 268 isoform X2 n=1 Tax=Ambystoma mexicanum TaxID=8296 RepID=UPI0037E854B9